jgi:hypothetical protein
MVKLKKVGSSDFLHGWVLALPWAKLPSRPTRGVDTGARAEPGVVADASWCGSEVVVVAEPGMGVAVGAGAKASVVVDSCVGAEAGAEAGHQVRERRGQGHGSPKQE